MGTQTAAWGRVPREKDVTCVGAAQLLGFKGLPVPSL